MHWQIFPNKNQKSQFTNGPLFVIKSDKENVPTSVGAQRLSDSSASVKNNNSVVPVIINSPIPEVSESNITMGTQPGAMPPKPPSSMKSKDSLQDIDSMNSIRSSKDYDSTNRIHQKYGKSNEIRELSEENRESNLSHAL